MGRCRAKSIEENMFKKFTAPALPGPHYLTFVKDDPPIVVIHPIQALLYAHASIRLPIGVQNFKAQRPNPRPMSGRR